jgi:hypothetical protein
MGYEKENSISCAKIDCRYVTADHGYEGDMRTNIPMVRWQAVYANNGTENLPATWQQQAGVERIRNA